MSKKTMFQIVKRCLLLASAFAMLLSAGVMPTLAAAPTGVFRTFTQNDYVDAEIVKVNPDGSLTYNKDPLSGSSLPDFSGVGYHGGEKEIPEVKVVKTIEPGDLGDHTKLIQDAINEVSALPEEKRGAILMKAGVYLITGQIKISASGVVLRGEGQGENGTIIYDSRNTQVDSFSISGSGSYSVDSTKIANITDTKVPFGQANFHVSDPSKFKVGDSVLVTITPNDAWIKALGVDNISGEGKNPWKASQYVMKYERTIVAINGDEITLDTSASMTHDTQYTTATLSVIYDNGRITESGLENVRFVSYYNKSVKDDENHGWNAVKVGNARNCWVKDVTCIYYGYSCVSLGRGAINVTVDSCSLLEPISQTTGGRKYSFCIDDATYCLVQNCYASKGRHDYVVQSQVSGPNVFYNSIADDSNSVSEPHHRWGTGTLYDNVYQVGATKRGYFEAIMRGNSGSGHGWAGVNTTFWNCLAPGVLVRKPQTEQNFAIVSYGLYGGNPSGASSYNNWFIKPDVTPADYPATQTKSGSPLYGNGYIEGWFNPVNPSSLYQAQLSYRLYGDATKNISPVSPMLNYPIYDAVSKSSEITVSGVSDMNADKVIVYVDGVKLTEIAPTKTATSSKFSAKVTLKGGYHNVSVSQVIAGYESDPTPIRVVHINNGDATDIPVTPLEDVLVNLNNAAAVQEHEKQVQSYVDKAEAYANSAQKSYDKLVEALIELENAITAGVQADIEKAQKSFNFYAPKVEYDVTDAKGNIKAAEDFGCDEETMAKIHAEAAKAEELWTKAQILTARAEREVANGKVDEISYEEELSQGGASGGEDDPAVPVDPIVNPVPTETNVLPMILAAVGAVVVIGIVVVVLVLQKRRK